MLLLMCELFHKVLDNQKYIELLVNSSSNIVGAIIGAFAALYIFKKGLRAQKAKEKEDELEKLSGIRNQFMFILSSLIDPIKKQEVAIEDFIKKIELETNELSSLKIISSLNIKEINSIPNESLFEIFVEKNIDCQINTNDYHLLKSNINRLEKTIYFIQYYLTYFQNRLPEIEKEWNMNIQSVSDLYDRYYHFALKVHDTDDIFFIGLNEVMKEWRKDPDSINYYVINKKYLPQFRKLCSNNYSDERAHMLLVFVSRSEMAFKNYLKWKSDFITSYKYCLESLKEVRETFENKLPK